MIKFIRAIFNALTNQTGNRYYSAQGRPDETVKGKMYQHYGFRSSPPTEGIELVHLEQGNNAISVAENDGQLLDVTQLEGATAVYSVHKNPANTNLISLESGGVQITTSTGNIEIRCKREAGGSVGVVIGSWPDTPGPTDVMPMALLTINFRTDEYANHVHAVTAVGSPTGFPVPIPEVAGRPRETQFTGAN